jgi:hypothetical protein
LVHAVSATSNTPAQELRCRVFTVSRPSSREQLSYYNDPAEALTPLFTAGPAAMPAPAHR